MDRYPRNVPTDTGPDGDVFGPQPVDDVELLEDRTRRIGRGRGTRRLGVSAPGAIAGAFLVGAIAFGATIRPAAPTSVAGSGDRPAVETAIDRDDDAKPAEETPAALPEDEPKHGATDDQTDEPRDEETDEPASDATQKPVAEEPDPTPAPVPDALELALAVKVDGRAIVVHWSPCEADGFVAYKIVRSTDPTVRWPAADGDKVLAAIGDRASTKFADRNVAAGRTYHYRVLALGKHDGAEFMACKSGVKGAAIPGDETEPKPTPVIGSLAIEVVLKEGHPKVAWSACSADGFDYYKVVRSTDATVSWPAGGNDTVVAAVGPDGDRRAWDANAPAGTTLFYRVFCVDKTEAGYVVLARSGVTSIATPVQPDPEPVPEPAAMGLDIEATADGVVLDWEPAAADGFAFYKVVRSPNENPSYLPGTEGSEVIAVIEDVDVTSFVDETADPGTWFYRIQAIGYWKDAKILLGQTPVRSVTLD